MSKIEVIGGKHLHGEIEIQGSKNAALPILAGCILNKGVSKINHCPKIQDVLYMNKILESVGCKIFFDRNTLVIDAGIIDSDVIPEQYVGTMRSSIILLGSMLGRMKHVTIAYPGGCSIGARPIDIHLDALRKMNIEIAEEENVIHCKTDKIIGADIQFRFPSVGATENIILAAVLAEGVTIIRNAAMEPEIIELCRYLKSLGAKIEGEGTQKIRIEGVEKLHDTEYTVVSDRIVTGTYMAALAAAGGSISLKTDCMEQILSTTWVMRKIGCEVETGGDYLTISSEGRKQGIQNLKTEPYPGFPTDMQSQIMAILIHANGVSTIYEEIFESRFKTADEFMKMGAKIEIDDRIATIHGVDKIHGTDLMAFDLRGGAALVVAALLAEGRSIISGSEYIERGYEDICSDLRNLGADIRLYGGME